MSNKPIYMLLKDIKKTSGKFDATHKVALYDVSKTSNEMPKWFKKFHEEEFKPLQEAFIKSQDEPPKWFSDFATQVLTRLDKHEQMFKIIIDRIDNLVAKNNLKE